jgi:hypothetical protein
MTKISKREDLLTICVIGLFALLAINFGGDYIFRGGQIEINELMTKGFTIQAEINTDQNKINRLVAEVLIQLDEDVRNNFKIVDQLIGIILRDEA